MLRASAHLEPAHVRPPGGLSPVCQPPPHCGPVTDEREQGWNQAEQAQFPNPHCIRSSLVPTLENHLATFTKNVSRGHTLAGSFPERPNPKEQNRPNSTVEAAQISPVSRTVSRPWSDPRTESYVPLMGIRRDTLLQHQLYF